MIGRASIGDMVQTFMLQRRITDLKSAMQTGLQEVSTGQAADLTRQLGGDHSALAGIDASLSRLTAFKSTVNEATLLTDTMQVALGNLGDKMDDLMPILFNASSPGNPAMITAAAAQGGQIFDGAIAFLNAQVGGRTVFAGQATDGPAVTDADTILTALETAITASGAVSALDVEQVVSDWFDDPAGFTATAYLGDAPLQALSVAEGENARLDFTANDPAVRNALKGLAMAALVDRGLFAGQVPAAADLIKRAGEQVLGSKDGLTHLSARLGLVQAQLGEASTRNAAEETALGIARNNMVLVDPYQAAMQLQETQNQLETIYTLTARVARLSLVDYI